MSVPGGESQVQSTRHACCTCPPLTVKLPWCLLFRGSQSGEEGPFFVRAGSDS